MTPRSTGQYQRVSLLVVAILFAIVNTATAQATIPDVQGWTPPMYAKGRQLNRGSFGLFPWESIDMASGAITLTPTDLTLPGTNGHDLVIQHAINLGGKGVSSRIGVPGPEACYMEARGGTPPQPDQWVINPNPTIENADGSLEYTFQSPTEPRVYYTRSYGRFTKPDASEPYRLELPNGLVYLFEQVGGPYGRLTDVQDQYGTILHYTYEGTADDPVTGGALASITQYVGTEERVVTFTHETNRTNVTWNGRTWRYDFDSTTGLLTRVTLPDGTAWTYTFSGNIFTVTTPNGGTVRYELTQVRDMTKVNGYYTPSYARLVPRKRIANEGTVPSDDLPTWTFDFQQLQFQGASSFSTSVTWPSGAITTYSHFRDHESYYVGQMILTGISTSGGGVSELVKYYFAGSPESNVSLPADPVGGDLQIQAEAAPAEAAQESGAPTLVTKVTVTRKNAGDATGQVLTTTVFYCGLNEAGNCTGSGKFNDFGNPRSVQEGGGGYTRTTRYAYEHKYPNASNFYLTGLVTQELVTQDERSFETRYEYGNPAKPGFVTKKSVCKEGTACTADGDVLVTEYSADDYGRVETETDPNGHVTTYGYSYGVVSSMTPPPCVTGQEGECQSAPPYTVTRVINADGRVTQETRDGKITRFTYNDPLGRETKREPPAGHAIDTTYAVTAGRLTSITTTRGATYTTTSLDGFGRLSGTENAAGVKTKVGYDDAGRKSSESYPYEGTMATPPGITTAYDAIGRPISVAYSGGGTVRYSYDDAARKVTVSDEDSRSTTYKYDAAGQPGNRRLVEVTDAKGGQWTYTYEGDALKSVKQGSQTRSWDYDGFHLLQSETHPESGTTQYTYDKAGNLKTRTDAENRITTYTYNRFNGLWTTNPGATFSGTNPQTWNHTTLSYDARGNRKTASADWVVSGFSYDDANRPTGRTDRIYIDANNRDDQHSRSFTTVYEPDDNDNIRKIIYPTGREVLYSYDNANRVTKIEDLSTHIVYAGDIEYWPSGAVKSFVTGEGRLHTMQEDARQRPETIDTGLVNLEYAYHPSGDVKWIVDRRPDATLNYSQTYHYDELHRLISGSGVWGTYAVTQYDAGGNQVERQALGKTVSFTYETAKNRLAVEKTDGIQTDSFGYNDAGELTADRIGTSYKYTPTGLLATAATTAGGALTFKYDADGNRKVKVAGGETSYFVHGPGNQILSEYREENGEAKPEKDYIYLGGRLLAGVTGLTAPPCTVSVPTDHWRAEFFNGLGAGTTPVMVQDHGTGSGVSRNWGSLSPGPACGVSANGFTVVWTRTATFEPGTYTFRLKANGGATLRIEGDLENDATDLSASSVDFETDWSTTTTRSITIQVEYRNLAGDASASLAWVRSGDADQFGIWGRIVFDDNGDGVMGPADQYVTVTANPCDRSRVVDGLRVLWTGTLRDGTEVPDHCEAGVGARFATGTLPPGPYQVTVDPPDDYPVVKGTPASATVQVGTTPSTPLTFFVSTRGSIGGSILADLNANDQLDEGEKYVIVPGATCEGWAVNGFQLEMTPKAGGAAEIRPIQTACGDPPAYRVTDVDPGTYDVRLLGPAGWRIQGGARVSVGGGHEATANFVARVPGTLYGHIILDTNGNRTRDSWEQYITTSATPCANSVAIDGFSVRWAGDVTGSSPASDCEPGVGARWATAAPPGSYFVTLTLPADYDVVPQTTTSQTVTVQSNAPRGAPFYVAKREGGIEGSIGVDVNGNGQVDETEKYVVTPGATCTGWPLSGVRLRLQNVTTNAVTFVAIQTTCGDPVQYLVAPVPNGTYDVELDGLPTGWRQEGAPGCRW